ncbi:MAG TPA: hypothetical protein V6C88_07765 [Chroococcidiopsis sp.]
MNCNRIFLNVLANCAKRSPRPAQQPFESISPSPSAAIALKSP